MKAGNIPFLVETASEENGVVEALTHCGEFAPMTAANFHSPVRGLRLDGLGKAEGSSHIFSFLKLGAFGKG
jgi:hypothetical protein